MKITKLVLLSFALVLPAQTLLADTVTKSKATPNRSVGRFNIDAVKLDPTEHILGGLKHGRTSESSSDDAASETDGPSYETVDGADAATRGKLSRMSEAAAQINLKLISFQWDTTGSTSVCSGDVMQPQGIGNAVCDVAVKVKKAGGGAEGTRAFKAKLSYTGSFGETRNVNVNVSPMASGEERTIRISARSIGAFKVAFLFRMKIDSQNQLVEANEGDNTASFSPG